MLDIKIIDMNKVKVIEPTPASDDLVALANKIGLSHKDLSDIHAMGDAHISAMRAEVEKLGGSISPKILNAKKRDFIAELLKKKCL